MSVVESALAHISRRGESYLWACACGTVGSEPTTERADQALEAHCRYSCYYTTYRKGTETQDGPDQSSRSDGLQLIFEYFPGSSLINDE